jgi:hypothetical protein
MNQNSKVENQRKEGNSVFLSNGGGLLDVKIILEGISMFGCAEARTNPSQEPINRSRYSFSCELIDRESPGH